MRKPWNLPAYPVYSLQTLDGSGNLNMNIMTYVIPVSMHPKHYILALYKGTQSLAYWNTTQRGVLQLLGPEHAPLVRILGKKSGLRYDKMQYLRKHSLLSGDNLLQGIAGYLEIEEIEKLPDNGGDHELFLCQVVSSGSYHENVLTTEILVEKKIIL